ncbi:hypothetical protein PFISCL1PPCAC_7975, partial [Pristionchus fissidentatus]
ARFRPSLAGRRSMEVQYDCISCGIFATELIVLTTASACAALASKELIQDGVLHYNFRVIMVMLCLRSLLQLLVRLYVIMERVFVVGEGDLPHQLLVISVKRFQHFEIGILLFFLSMERILALLDGKYE